MAVQAREITFQIKVQDQSRATVAAFAESLGGVGTAAAKAGVQVEGLGVSTNKAATASAASTAKIVGDITKVSTAEAKAAAEREARYARSAEKRAAFYVEEEARMAALAAKQAALPAGGTIKDLAAAYAAAGAGAGAGAAAGGGEAVGGAEAATALEAGATGAATRLEAGAVATGKTIEEGTLAASATLEAGGLAAGNELTRSAAEAAATLIAAARGGNAIPVAGAAAGAGKAVAGEAIAAGLGAEAKAAEKATVALATHKKGLADQSSILDLARDKIYGFGAALGGLFGKGKEAGLADVAKDVENVGEAAVKSGTKVHGLAGIVREAVVILRELGRGDFSRLAGSATILADRAGKLVTLVGIVANLAPFLAVAAVGIHEVEKQANDTSGIDAYIDKLGLTKAQSQKLKDDNGPITFFQATKAAAQEAAVEILEAMGSSTKKAGTFFSHLKDDILYFMKAAVVGTVGIVLTLGEFIGTFVANAIKLFYNLGVGIGNAAAIGIEYFVNFLQDGLAKVGGLINQLSEKAGLGDIVPKFNGGRLAITGLTDGMKSFGHASLDASENLKKVNAGLDKYAQNTVARAQRNKRQELLEDAQDILSRENPKKGRKGRAATPDSQALDPLGAAQNKADIEASALLTSATSREEAVTKQLLTVKDAEIVALLKEYDLKDTVANRSKVWIAAKQAELDTLGRTLVANAEQGRVLKEAQKIYDAAINPLRNYNEAQLAALKVTKEHPEAQAEATKAVNKAKAALDDYLDPLQKLKDQVADSVVLSGLRGSALARETEFQKELNRAIADGRVKRGDKAGEATLRSQVDPLLEQGAEAKGRTQTNDKLDDIRQEIALTGVLEKDRDQISKVLAFQKQLDADGIWNDTERNKLLLEYATGLKQLEAAKKKAGNDIGSGLREGLQAIKEGAGTLRTEFAGIVTSVFGSIQSHFAELLKTGKTSIRGLLSDIGGTLIDASTKQLTAMAAGGIDSALGGKKDDTGAGLLKQARGMGANNKTTLGTSANPMHVIVAGGLGGASNDNGGALGGLLGKSKSTDANGIPTDAMGDIGSSQWAGGSDTSGSVSSIATSFIPELKTGLNSITSGLGSVGSGFLSGFSSILSSVLGGMGGGGVSSLAMSLFADGGIMTEFGSVPLRKYSGGGIANSPQLAMYGEGSTPEAYVPVPSGRIPVQLSGGSQSSPTINHVNMTVHAKDANSFNKSKGQVMGNYARELARQSKRNN